SWRPAPPQRQPARVRGREVRGALIHPVGHGGVVAGLLDAPGLFLDYLGVYFTDKPQGDPRLDNGLVVVERAARWNLVGEKALHISPLPHRAEFPPSLRTRTALVTADTTPALPAARREP